MRLVSALVSGTVAAVLALVEMVVVDHVVTTSSAFGGPSHLVVAEVLAPFSNKAFPPSHGKGLVADTVGFLVLFLVVLLVVLVGSGAGKRGGLLGGWLGAVLGGAFGGLVSGGLFLAIATHYEWAADYYVATLYSSFAQGAGWGALQGVLIGGVAAALAPSRRRSGTTPVQVADSAAPPQGW